MEAHGFDVDLILEPRLSARRAWAVAGGAGALSLVLATALVLVLPLKETQVFTVLVDRQTGAGRCGLHLGAARTHRLGEAGQFLGAFLLVPQQHQKGSQLAVFGFVIEQHAHGFAGFFAGQVARAALALAEDAHELGEGVFCWSAEVHRQLVGLGRPASLAASLAGVPLNN